MSEEPSHELDSLEERILSPDFNRGIVTSLTFHIMPGDALGGPREREMTLEGQFGVDRLQTVILRQNYTEDYKNQLKQVIRMAVNGFAHAVCTKIDEM